MNVSLRFSKKQSKAACTALASASLEWALLYRASGSHARLNRYAPLNAASYRMLIGCSSIGWSLGWPHKNFLYSAETLRPPSCVSEMQDADHWTVKRLELALGRPVGGVVAAAEEQHGKFGVLLAEAVRARRPAVRCAFPKAAVRKGRKR